jgi:hypothetical protein
MGPQWSMLNSIGLLRMVPIRSCLTRPPIGFTQKHSEHI